MNEKQYTEKELAYISKLMADGLDRKHAEWYLKIMQICTKDDYDYNKFHRKLYGIEDEEDSPK
jgi:hypothetical protein